MLFLDSLISLFGANVWIPIAILVIFAIALYFCIKPATQKPERAFVFIGCVLTLFLAFVSYFLVERFIAPYAYNMLILDVPDDNSFGQQGLALHHNTTIGALISRIPYWIFFGQLIASFSLVYLFYFCNITSKRNHNGSVVDLIIGIFVFLGVANKEYKKRKDSHVLWVFLFHSILSFAISLIVATLVCLAVTIVLQIIAITVGSIIALFFVVAFIIWLNFGGLSRGMKNFGN